MLHWDGNNWTSATSPTSLNLEALAFVNNNNGWAIGSVWVPGPALIYDNVFYTGTGALGQKQIFLLFSYRIQSTILIS